MRAPWLGRFARSVIRELALHVAIALGAAITLFVAIDSAEAVNRALSRATVEDMLLLELYNIPSVIQQFGSFAVLIGGTTAIAALIRRGEVLAMFAAGASPAAIAKPALIAGLAFASIDALITELIIPGARAEVGVLRRRLGLPASATDTMSANRAWFRGEDLVYRVEALDDPRGRVLAGVLILRLEEGRLLDRWDVDRLVFEDRAWNGEGIVHRVFGATDTLETQRHARAPIALRELPDDFVRFIGAPDRLPYASLVETTRARERLGQPAAAHRLELYRRLAHPLAIAFAVVLAAAIALRLGRRPSLAQALAAGALFGFILWVFDEVGVALGATGAMAPIGAAHVSLAVAALLTLFAWRPFLSS